MRPTAEKLTYKIAALLAFVSLACACKSSRANDPPDAESSDRSSSTVTSRSPPSDSPTVAMIDPRQLLFSLPTLSDSLPRVNPVSSGASFPTTALRMHEDDWRQLEFVLAKDRPVVDRELRELAQFKVEHHDGPGWTDVYIRKSRPESVEPAGIRLATLMKTIGATTKRLFYLETGGALAKVRYGFAINVDGMILYGHASADDRVASLGLIPGESDALTNAQKQKLSALCQTLDLFLVDWFRGAVVPL